MRDIFSRLDFKRGLSPAVAVTNDDPFVSQIVDLQGCNAAVFVLQTGSLADANATFVVLVEDGDVANLSDNAAVVDDQLNGTEVLAGFTFAADNGLRKIGYRGDKRYARVTVTPSGNTGDVYLSGLWVLDRNTGPTSNPPT